MVLGIQYIIAVVQEGSTLNFALWKKEPHYKTVPSFRGLRLRDHIEVCVTTLALIHAASIEVVDPYQSEHGYNSRFAALVAAPLLPDVTSP